MSINWVMMREDGKGFVPLPKERILHASPARTALSIRTPNSYPGKEPLDLTSSSGTAYVTNQRVIYLPNTSSPALRSFSAPTLNLLDSHVAAPWIGANAWVAILKPVTGGGIPAQHAFVEVKLTFKDGGAYEFHQMFEEVKEHLSRAADHARDSGRTPDLSDVPLEQLPAYEASGSSTAAPASHRGPNLVAPTPIRPNLPSTTAVGPIPLPQGPPPAASPAHSAQVPPPDEPPPGYEEAQSASVMNSFEESMRRANS